MKKIIILIGFNSFDFDNFFNLKNLQPPRLTKEWIDYRMDIFMKYTCKSLINQTNQNFTTVVTYDKSSESLILDAINKYDKLPENIIFTAQGQSIVNHLIKDYDFFYQVRLDSDDMYHPTFIQQLLDYNPKKETQVLINQGGYVYDSENDRLAKWYYESPPFYTLIYNVDEYLNDKLRYKFEGHASAINLKYEVLENGNYTVILHGKNTLNRFTSNCQVGVIDDETIKINILREFNILDKDNKI